MGQPREGMLVQNKKMATPFRNNIRQKNVAVNNLFASNAYQARFDKNICESDG